MEYIPLFTFTNITFTNTILFSYWLTNTSRKNVRSMSTCNIGQLIKLGNFSSNFVLGELDSPLKNVDDNVI